MEGHTSLLSEMLQLTRVRTTEIYRHRLELCYSEDGKQSKNERGKLARFANEVMLILGLLGLTGAGGGVVACLGFGGGVVKVLA